MINERLFPNIVHKTDNDEEYVYVNDPATKRFPLLQLYDELSQEQDTLQILLVGEGSIGKSTSLRLLQAELMIRGIYCARYECRHLNDRSIPDIRKEMEQWPKDTVVMIDAYDELNPNWSSSLDDAVTAIRERGFALIVTSRQKPIGTIYEDFTRYEVQEFSDEQIEEILGDTVDRSAPVYELLRNTMFFSMYLHMDRHSVSVKDIEDEASFMFRYFAFLLRDKNDQNNDLFSLCYAIGQAFYLRFTNAVQRNSLRLPDALRHIVTEEGDRQNGYTVSASQIKYENFFVALYMMEELLLASKKQDIDRAHRLFDISLMDDHTDAYVYAGQLLRRQEKGKAVLGWLNDEKVYPKSFCEGYTHVLLLYLGMNKGCFNCGEMTEEGVFEPKVFGLCSGSRDTTMTEPQEQEPTSSDPITEDPSNIRSSEPITIYWNDDSFEVDDIPLEKEEGEFFFEDEEDTISYERSLYLNQYRHKEPNWESKINNGINIPACAFHSCQWLIEIVIPNSVSHVGSAAFFKCWNLRSVTLPQELAYIDDAVFEECVNLSSIILPKGLEWIGVKAFAECVSLRHVTIPSGVTYIGNDAFQKCVTLQSIHIPKDTTAIGAHAFMDCFELPCIDLPHGIESIEEGTFMNCFFLQSVCVPEGVTSINDSAFQRCDSLSSIFIPDSVTHIGSSAFNHCRMLSSIKLPKGLTQIQNHTFYNSALKSIIIPPGVTYIGNSAFELSDIQSITLPEGITYIGVSAFSRCQHLQSIRIPFGVNYIFGNTFESCTRLQSVQLPQSIRDISPYAFSRCSSLQSIIIPGSITHICFYAFEECISLKKVIFREEEPFFQETDATHLFSPSTVISPETIIGRNAFIDCYNLRSIIFSTQVSSIDTDAFLRCRSLQMVSFHSENTQVSPDSFSGIPPFTAYVPLGSTPWYRSQLPSSCTIIETDFEQNIDIEQENDLTL